MILRILNYVNKYQKKKLANFFLIYPTTASAISSRLTPAK